ncbi:MAG: hypothetical protein KJ548_07200 [Actinobacteria bacterium]|nr:hypothetical protein [Actinomycetota bacterium]MCG2797921.1 hypothetical protein [Cellulomonas sp.]
MFTKSHDWRRWSGPRAEITAAIGLASEVLEQLSGVPSTTAVRITYSNQLTETLSDPGALDRTHFTDLRSIEDVWIDVKTDFAQWRLRARERDERAIDRRSDPEVGDRAPMSEPSSPAISAVSFRLGKDRIRAMQVSVEGSDRTSVEGLMGRLVAALNRSTEGPSNFSSEWVWVALFPFAIVALLLASYVVHAFNFAPIDGRYEWQEIVIPILSVAATICLFASTVWVFPKLELLDSGTRSRFRRFRALIFSGLGAIVAGIIATAVYAAML